MSDDQRPKIVTDIAKASGLIDEAGAECFTRLNAALAREFMAVESGIDMQGAFDFQFVCDGVEFHAVVTAKRKVQ